MRILVLSDSHYKVEPARYVLSKLKNEIDYAIHLGDNDTDMEMIMDNINIPYVTVSGNCDFTNKSLNDMFITLDNVKFFICHGHNYNVKTTLTKVYHKALSENANVVLFGHTHHPVNTTENGILFVNPGSISLPRGVSYKSYAIITINNNIANAKIVAITDNNTLKPFDRFNKG